MVHGVTGLFSFFLWEKYQISFIHIFLSLFAMIPGTEQNRMIIILIFWYLFCTGNESCLQNEKDFQIEILIKHLLSSGGYHSGGDTLLIVLLLSYIYRHLTKDRVSLGREIKSSIKIYFLLFMWVVVVVCTMQATTWTDLNRRSLTFVN